MLEAQVAFLLKVREQGKGEMFRVTRQRIIDGLSMEFWRAYCSSTITYKELRELNETMRDVLSWDSLLGVKQMSLYDLLDDETLVKTMETEE